MSEKFKKYRISIILILTTSIVFLIIHFNLVTILNYLAPDHEVKSHLVKEIDNYLIIAYILFLLLLLIYSLRSLCIKLVNKINFKSSVIIQNYSKLENIIIVILLLYIILSSLITVYRFDISTDEATYIYTVQHYYEKGEFLYKTSGDELIIPKDMLGQNIVVMLIKPLTHFSIYIPRLISFFYSAAILLLLFFIIRKNFKKTASLVFLVLYAAYPGFIFISGSSFGENIGIFYVILGLIFYSKYQSQNKYSHLIFSSVFLAIAILTKLQLGYFLFFGFGIIIIINFFNNKKLSSEIKLLILTSFFSVLILFAFYSLFYDVIEIKRALATFYLIGSGGVVPSEPIITTFINYERFFNFQTILLASLIIVYIFSYRYEKSYMEKLIFYVVVVNAIWFMVFKGHGFRFMYFAQFGLILISVVPITRLFINNENVYFKKFITLFLSLFLILGIIQSTKLTLDGVSNNALIYLNGNNPFKTYHSFVKNNEQKDFFTVIKNYVSDTDEVFLIGAESELMALIPNKFHAIDPDNFNVNSYSGKFVIYTAVNTQLDINKIYNSFIKNNCVFIFNRGDYYLYKIK